MLYSTTVIRRIGAPKELPTPIATHISAALLSLFLSHILKYYSVQIPSTRSNVDCSTPVACGEVDAITRPIRRNPFLLYHLYCQ